MAGGPYSDDLSTSHTPADQKNPGRVEPTAGAPSREVTEQTRSLPLPKRDYAPQVKDGRN